MLSVRRTIDEYWLWELWQTQFDEFLLGLHWLPTHMFLFQIPVSREEKQYQKHSISIDWKLWGKFSNQENANCMGENFCGICF